MSNQSEACAVEHAGRQRMLRILFQAGGHLERLLAPELAAICTRLNHLAATLGDAIEEKRKLAERAVSLQDLERKEIAHELHDEFGPYLFALRAHAGALMRLAGWKSMRMVP